MSPCLTGVKRVLEVSWTLFRVDRGAFTHPDRPWCASRTRGNLRSTKFQGTYAARFCQSHADITRHTDHKESRWTNRRDWPRSRLASRGQHQTWRLRSSTGSVVAVLGRYGALKFKYFWTLKYKKYFSRYKVINMYEKVMWKQIYFDVLFTENE